MLSPDERYCRRIFHGMMDQREMYDERFDENADESDDIKNFKFDPERPEDVELFNLAFLDRISRIWNNREDYFHSNPLLIEWFDSYSNLAFQMHMVELYKQNIKDRYGDDYDELDIEGILMAVKNNYSDFTMYKKYYDGLATGGDFAQLIRKYIAECDELSEELKEFGYANGLPF